MATVRPSELTSKIDDACPAICVDAISSGCFPSAASRLLRVSGESSSRTPADRQQHGLRRCRRWPGRGHRPGGPPRRSRRRCRAGVAAFGVARGPPAAPRGRRRPGRRRAARRRRRGRRAAGGSGEPELGALLGRPLLGLLVPLGGLEERDLGLGQGWCPAWALHCSAWASRTPRYSSLSGRPSESQASAAPLRWCRIRWPSMSSSSQARNRGQARASASWAISTTPASLVTSRDATSRSIRCSWSGSADSRRRGHPAADRLALGPGGHQPQHQVAQQVPLLGFDARVDLLGRLRDRAADATGRGVPGHGQRVALASLPRLQERVRQHRQCARRPLDLADQQVDETRLRSTARPAARAPRRRPAGLARSSPPAGAGRARAFARSRGRPRPRPAGPPASPRPAARARLAATSAAKKAPARPRRRTARRPPRTGRRGAPTARPGAASRQRLHRVLARGDDDDARPVPAQRRSDPRPHQ